MNWSINLDKTINLQYLIEFSLSLSLKSNKVWPSCHNSCTHVDGKLNIEYNIEEKSD